MCAYLQLCNRGVKLMLSENLRELQDFRGQHPAFLIALVRDSSGHQ